MESGNNSPRGRLQTPGGASLRDDEVETTRCCRRSRSRNLRMDDRKHRSRSRSASNRVRSSRELVYGLREREDVLEREKRRPRVLEEEVRRERSLLRRDVSDCRRASTSEQRPCRRAATRPLCGSNRNGPSEGKRRRESACISERSRSRSPTFSTKDVINILKSIKNNSLTPGTPISSNINHKNILSDFDPSSKNQRIDIWLKKVNECAAVYGWDEKITIHFAIQKLQGLAKIWVESLDSILFTWPEWQNKLIAAFPCEQNYGQLLEDMLRRKSRSNEPLEVYYYEKLALINQCSIEGKRAVDCIIHGLSDRTMKSSALALRCSHPDQLLQFLMSNKETVYFQGRSNFKNKINLNVANSSLNIKNRTHNLNNNSNISCFNCKEKGHVFFKCPKPLIKCTFCHKYGHKIDNCSDKLEIRSNKEELEHQTMCIHVTKPNSKFMRLVEINKVPIQAFIDFGSEVSILTKSALPTLGLTCNNAISILKGFGNEIVHSIGKVSAELRIDEVSGLVEFHVVEDDLLDTPLLVGQSFTEQTHVAVYKNSEELRFYNLINEMPFTSIDFNDLQTIKIITTTALKIFGPAAIKVVTEPYFEGNIFLNGRIIGKPTQQYAIMGVVYQVMRGIVNIDVRPLLYPCQLPGGNIISRATVVQIVNRIANSISNDQVQIHSEIDETNIKVGKTVNESQKQRLVELLKKFKHCFASNLKELGYTNAAEMTIEVNSKRPIVYRPYRLSYKEREHVRDMVSEMLEADIIRESVSEYASPIILVRKKDGKLRLCVDYRLLNSITTKERYPMPNIEDEIARLSGQAYFITLDLASGYYQVPIAEASRPMTSFVTPDGQYEFNRMPFGLANAPAVFQRMMNRVLGSSRYTEATAYIDDVLIYGKDIEQCLVRLENILKLIEDANLTLNLSKCEFLQDKINYLGYEISAAGVRPGNKKIQCVIDFPRPTNQHTVRQFLGLVGYFRKFIKNFAIISHPLNKLLRINQVWIWSDEQEQAFCLLKEKLINRPILTIYDPTSETEIHSDASKIGIGGILLQRANGSNNFLPVAFYSRQTSPEERNFHSYELETLAVVCSLRKFRVYLIGQKFKIVTDCSALRSTFAKRDIIPRIARWWLLLQEFQCSIDYRPGSKMAHVDALSRNPVIENNSDLLNEYPTVMRITDDDWLLTLQLGDTDLRRIREILLSDIDTDGLKYIKENYLIKDNGIYICINGDRNNIRWVVPKGARWQLLKMNHDDIGHFGVEKTMQRIKQSYWFPKMSRFIKKYVAACIECAYAKKLSSSKEGKLHVIEKIDIPFHTLHIDHLGPFVRSKRSNSYILVVIDGFTKFIFIKPIKNTKSLITIRVLEEIFYVFRNPNRIISDRGTCFTSHVFKRFCLDKGIKHVLNAVASPRANGQVERYNRTILDSLKAQNLNFDDKNWDEKVGRVQWGLNNTIQKTTGRSPAEVLFGTSMNTELDPRLNGIRQETRESTDLAVIREEVKDRIDSEQDKQKQYYDKDRLPARIYSEGELVKITKTNFNNDGKSKKLLPAYIGPFRVVRVLGNDRYRVAPIPGLSSTKNVRNTTVAADRMLPWVHVAALEINADENDSDDDSNK